MKTLKQLLFTFVAVVGLALAVSAQKNDPKKPPPKNPPVVNPGDKSKPREKPQEKPKKPEMVFAVMTNRWDGNLV